MPKKKKSKASKPRKKSAGKAKAKTKASKRTGRHYNLGRAAPMRLKGKTAGRVRKKRKTVTLRQGRAMPVHRKRKLISQGFLDAQGRVNPRRKKRKGKKGSRRRSSSRRRRNPPGIVAALREVWGKQSMPILGGQAVLGMSGAVVGPALAETYLGRYGFENRGWKGVLMTAASAGAMYVGGSILERQINRLVPGRVRPVEGLGYGLALGGVIATLIRGAYEYAPGAFEWLKLSAPRTPSIMPMGKAQAGMADWMELRGLGRGGMRGLGSVTDPESLVAGESFARSVNQFDGVGDWMELKGLGADFRIPMQDIRAPGQLLGMGAGPGLPGIGYPGQYGGTPAARFRADSLNYTNISGLGDWVEMMPDTNLAMEQWNPAMETF